MTRSAFLKNLRQIQPGTIIPKPAAHGDFSVKGWGRRADQDALVYLIPNHTNPSKPYEKGITLAEWVASYDYLIEKGEITRKWFDRSLTRCSSEGGCNFTTMGGILCLLGIERYAQRGVYRKV